MGGAVQQHFRLRDQIFFIKGLCGMRAYVRWLRQASHKSLPNRPNSVPAEIVDHKREWTHGRCIRKHLSLHKTMIVLLRSVLLEAQI
jgi:hypothetical protein